MTQSPRRSKLFEGGASSRILPAPLLSFVDGASIVEITDDGGEQVRLPQVGRSFLYAPNILQDQADYRGLLRQWFAMVDVGDKLAIEVPHSFLCEREVALPSRAQPSRRRLYTPGSLLNEVEEALEPNSYRVRLLCDHDQGYDYDSDVPRGTHAILLVLERIKQPAWSLDQGVVETTAGPDFRFEPARTRIETAVLV